MSLCNSSNFILTLNLSCYFSYRFGFRCFTDFVLLCLVVFLHFTSGFIAGEKHYIINTTSAQIKREGISNVTSGKIEDKTFHGPNNGIWNYSVAAFNFTSSEAKDIFHEKNKISIRGTNALSVIVQGNFTVGTDLDVSGKNVSFTSNDKQLFWLGGFIRMNKTCCTLGK